MATKKQLANLAKARAARAAKAKAKAPKKTQVKSSPKFIVKITRADGRTGYSCNGGKFDTNITLASKLSESGANKRAREIFDLFKKYLRQVEVIPAKKSEGAQYKKNPVPHSSKAAIREAADLFEEFTGHDASYFDEVPLTIPKAAAKIGRCDGIMYETVRDGKVEHYIHKFKKSARPVLAASHNGRQLLLIGGNFAFTDRGIVDN